MGEAAECLLALARPEQAEDDAEDRRRFVGAVLVCEALRDLRVLRRALTQAG